MWKCESKSQSVTMKVWKWYWSNEDRNQPPDNLSTLDGGNWPFSTRESLYPWALPAYIVFLACLLIRLKFGEFWTAFKEGWCVFTAEWDYNLLPDNLWSCSFHPSHLCTMYIVQYQNNPCHKRNSESLIQYQWFQLMQHRSYDGASPRPHDVFLYSGVAKRDRSLSLSLENETVIFQADNP